jgi:hypothetical protein
LPSTASRRVPCLLWLHQGGRELERAGSSPRPASKPRRWLLRRHGADPLPCLLR